MIPRTLLRRPNPVALRRWPVLLLVALAGCARPTAPPAPAPAKVVATHPLKMPIVEWDEYVGRIEPIEQVDVRARVSGHLESTHFEEGQLVQAGDLLCILDQRPFRIAAEQAEADLAGTSARVQEAKAQLVQSEAEVRSAESQLVLAGQQLERTKRLLSSNAQTQEGLDIRESTFKQATADVDVRRARVLLAKAAVVTAEADHRAAESRLAAARLNLEYTEVRAPVTGRVGRRIVTDGNLISGGSEQSTLLTTIVSLDPIYCDFDADEQSYLKYERLARAGELSDLRATKLPVFVRLADERSGFPHQGHLDFLDNRLDRKTATMRTRAILPNQDFALTPGLFAKVRIPGSGRREATLIPDSAVATDQSEKFVLVVGADQKIRRQRVELGRTARGLRIVREGLTGDEPVVIRGMQRATPGAQVDATIEETLAADDGLPDDAAPLPREKWLQSYVRRGEDRVPSPEWRLTRPVPAAVDLQQMSDIAEGPHRTETDRLP